MSIRNSLSHRNTLKRLSLGLGTTILLFSSYCYADDLSQPVTNDELDAASEAIDSGTEYVDKLRAKNLKLLNDLREAEQKYSESTEGNKDKLEKINSMKKVIDRQNQYLSLIQDDFKAYTENVEKYTFINNGKKYMPYLYMLAALSSSKDTAESKVLYALAGYGTGALIENSGYGLTNLAAYIKFDLLKW